MTEDLGGLAGRILRVNLTRGEVQPEPTPRALFERFLGGRGVGAHLLFHELARDTDPLGPDNKLIFLTGPLEGTLAPGANKITVTFRSPLTNTYSFSLCGGHLAPELKFAGYDGVIVEGQSERPVYLWIDNDRAELRDAGHLWGKLTHDTEDAIRAELRDPAVRVAVIGPAGEKLVRFACIQTDYHREFGRGGAGAVMGAKKLKAIAVRGTGQVNVADPAGLARLAEAIYAALAEHPKAQARRQYGTPEMVEGVNALGYWATRNFTTGYFEGADKLKGVRLKEQVYVGDNSCYGCPVACGKISPVMAGPFAGAAIEGSEFETIGLLGANCGVADPAAIVAATAICDAYGFDTMSAGAVVSMAMECYERGLIGPADTGGIDLRFGNGEALIAMVQAIAERQGLGSLLAEGSRRAAQELGAPELAMQVKGQELATYEPRGVVGMGLSYAVSPKGGHHMIAPTMGAESAGDPARRLRPDGKAKLVRDTQLIMAVVDSLALCSSMRFVLGLDDVLALYRAVTGHALDESAALRAAEQITNLERLFNVREGFRRRDDTLPRRLLEEPMPTGPSAGNVVPLAVMLDEYYALMGWDDDGVPTSERAQQLELDAEWQQAIAERE
ncbi:MAG: aldehyde ferredoxin oxidoreductase family protein [Chloroflexi bacterium]|nr:aldehyde ferredoxin oxidoreductase family protein [Chloroflexota bacterium]MBU1748933.1 aldehyde ferredoxin oxidoreductase family protein [Chloroflexota bacterium]